MHHPPPSLWTQIYTFVVDPTGLLAVSAFAICFGLLFWGLFYLCRRFLHGWERFVRTKRIPSMIIGLLIILLPIIFSDEKMLMLMGVFFGLAMIIIPLREYIEDKNDQL